jgi:hypothetical protein
LSAFDRARERVGDLVKRYERPARSRELLAELRDITTRAARRFGMADLPAASHE